jgi:hypothetical protein
VNALYAKYRQASESWTQAGLLAPIDLGVDDLRVVLLDTGLYTVDLALDQFLSDVPALAQVSMSNTLTTPTTTNGIFDADDGLCVGVVGPTVEALLIMKWTGVAATSPLIAYFDTVVNLPLTPTGQNEIIVWPATPSKIFKI